MLHPQSKFCFMLSFGKTSCFPQSSSISTRWALGHKLWPMTLWVSLKLFHPTYLGGSSQDLDTWLISMVIVSPPNRATWDPFQMAFHFMASRMGVIRSPLTIPGIALQVGTTPCSTWNILKLTLPETNSSPLKMDGWNTTFLLGRPIFKGYVSFRDRKSAFCHVKGGPRAQL